MTGQFVTLGSKYNKKNFTKYPSVVLKENESGVVVLDIFDEKNIFVNTAVLDMELTGYNVIIDVGAYQFGVTRLSLKGWRQHKFQSGESSANELAKLILDDGSIVITVINRYFVNKIQDIVHENATVKLKTVEQPLIVNNNSFESTNSGDVPVYARRR